MLEGQTVECDYDFSGFPMLWYPPTIGEQFVIAEVKIVDSVTYIRFEGYDPHQTVYFNSINFHVV